jgi:glycosyltransferase involved in cell wall biosynthesis
MYTHGSFPSYVWDRYLAHFDEIEVVARDGGTIGNDGALARSDHPQVRFTFLQSLASAKQLLLPSRASVTLMEEAVQSADGVIARLPSEIGLLAIKVARLVGRPYAVEVVGCALDGFSHHGSPIAKLYAPVLFRRMRRAVRDAPLALYVTSEWLQTRYPTTGSSVSASNVEIAPLTNAERRNRERRLSEIRSGRAPKLGTIASLSVKTKGVQTALAALGQLRSAGMDLSYSVLGSGDTEPWSTLAEKIGVSDLVSFAGTRASPQSVRCWLDEIDIYLQPSFQEGLPRATIEAMSRGAACIGSTCGGIPELVEVTRTHAPGDATGLAALIARLATQTGELSDAAWRDLEISQRFLPQNLNARRRKLYAQLRDAAEHPSVTR